MLTTRKTKWHQQQDRAFQEAHAELIMLRHQLTVPYGVARTVMRARIQQALVHLKKVKEAVELAACPFLADDPPKRRNPGE